LRGFGRGEEGGGKEIHRRVHNSRYNALMFFEVWQRSLGYFKIPSTGAGSSQRLGLVVVLRVVVSMDEVDIEMWWLL
jgi:hypothetical protein